MLTQGFSTDLMRIAPNSILKKSEIPVEKPCVNQLPVLTSDKEMQYFISTVPPC